MDEALRRFREAADQENRGRGRGTVRRRYSKDLQVEAVRYWQTRQRAGDRLRDVASALGVAPWSLRRWWQSVATLARFHRVDVVAAEPAPTAPGLAVVITAQGPRVEGLDVEGVARLLTLLR
jgi:transposase-like protein